jgi:glycosyltransferase involved in cell wall biosynthesis
VDYCEYYFAPEHRDLSYRLDLPAVRDAGHHPRAINAAALAGLVACEAGYSPTHWQRDSFPRRFAGKIEVHFDGVDTELYRPGPPPSTIAGQEISPRTRVVTFVARGLEALRGFDLFLRLARRLADARPDVRFVVAGDEGTYYGWDRLQTGGVSFKEWALSRVEVDLSRFLFLGHVEPVILADVLRRSDLHVYLGVPFVPSWSLWGALASGCVVLAGDVPPVREVIEPNRAGLLGPLLDVEGLAEVALRVLDQPQEYRPLGEARRRLVEERYALDVAVPALKDFFTRVARIGRRFR